MTSFDGTRLTLYSWGPEEAPLLVPVHGLGRSAGSWGEVPQRLADQHRVVAYDLRGHAQSGEARSVRALSDRAIRHLAIAPEEPIEHVRRMRDDFLTTRPLALAGSTLANVTQDGVEWAPSLRVPALVVHGSRDPEVPGEDAQRLLEALPDGELSRSSVPATCFR